MWNQASLLCFPEAASRCVAHAYLETYSSQGDGGTWEAEAGGSLSMRPACSTEEIDCVVKTTHTQETWLGKGKKTSKTPHVFVFIYCSTFGSHPGLGLMKIKEEEWVSPHFPSAGAYALGYSPFKMMTASLSLLQTALLKHWNTH